jgi:predicted lipoprotein
MASVAMASPEDRLEAAANRVAETVRALAETAGNLHSARNVVSNAMEALSVAQERYQAAIETWAELADELGVVTADVPAKASYR